MPGNNAPNPPAAGDRRKGKANPNSKRQQRLRKRTESALPPAALEFRKRFIDEYLVDFRAGDAYLRAGGKVSSQKNVYQRGYDMLSEPYVALKIREAIDNAEESKLINRNRVIAGLVRESNYHALDASHGARVTAHMGLAKILAMTDRPVAPTNGAVGGILVVPAVEKLDSWEKRSADAQKALKDSVRK